MNERSIGGEKVANIVFLHGAGDSASIWELQARHFGGRHSVLAAELPGRGRRIADVPNEEHAANARDVISQMDRAGMDRAIVVGHSMGGAVALTIGLDFPDRCTALVLATTGARLKMHPDFLASAKAQADRAPSDPPKPPPVSLEKAVSAKASTEARQWLATRVATASARATYADFAANDGFDVRERLSAIRLPVLVVAAEDDQMAPVKFSEFLARNLPHATLRTIAGAGHYPMVEREADFNGTLEAFIDDVGR
jgi:pimeloyl-ACP methyl ester carboxylesterase